MGPVFLSLSEIIDILAKQFPKRQTFSKLDTMRKFTRNFKWIILLLMTALSLCCKKEDKEDKALPRLISLEATPGITTATIKATFEGNMKNITEAEFMVRKVGGDSQYSKPDEISGNTMTVTFNNISPRCRYEYTITYGNGIRSETARPKYFDALEYTKPRVGSMKITPDAYEAYVEATFEDSEYMDFEAPHEPEIKFWADGREYYAGFRILKKDGDVFRCTIPDLTPETRYFVTARIYYGGYLATDTGRWIFNTLPPPLTAEISAEPSYESAKLSATVSTIWDDYQPCGFIYYMYGNPKDTVTVVPENNLLECVVTSLKPNRRYEYSMFYTHDGKTMTTEEDSFTTLKIPIPEVISLEVTPSSNSALLSADIQNAEFIKKVGFRLGYTSSSEDVYVEHENGRITYLWENLEPETEYGFQVLINNGYGYSYSEWKSFTTKADETAPEKEQSHSKKSQ